jgi:GrpB-like predicted nucleotidyltransferase (UPF0157 family)
MPERSVTEMELIGGAEHRRIVVVQYDEEWPRTFERHRQSIQHALGSSVRIEHVGSTAVPGLAAKPIVDVQISVGDVESEQTYVPALTAVGYALRVRQRHHRMLRTPRLDVHVHVCSRASEWERRHLLFRDWLRTDDRDRSAYEALKRTLAARDWETMNDYADAKGEFIATALERAEAWARRTGWHP